MSLFDFISKKKISFSIGNHDDRMEWNRKPVIWKHNTRVCVVRYIVIHCPCCCCCDVSLEFSSSSSSFPIRLLRYFFCCENFFFFGNSSSVVWEREIPIKCKPYWQKKKNRFFCFIGHCKEDWEKWGKKIQEAIKQIKLN